MVRNILSIYWIIFITWISFISASSISDNSPPVLVSEVEKHRIGRAGDRLRLVCPVQSSPPPIFEWAKDGHVINAAWLRHRLKDDQMYIKDLELDDTGVYTCRATNGFGKIELAFSVYVSPVSNHSIPLSSSEESYVKEILERTEIPRFINLGDMLNYQRITISPGSSLSLQCRVTGRPSPEIRWYKDGVDIQGKGLPGQKDENKTESDRWTLKIPDVKESHQGSYECKASNKAGTVNFTYNVDVKSSSINNLAEFPLFSAAEKDSVVDNSSFALILIIGVTTIVTGGIVITAVIIFCAQCKMSRSEGLITELHSATTSLPLITGSAHKQYSSSSPAYRDYNASHYCSCALSEHSYAVLEPPKIDCKTSTANISESSGKCDVPFDSCITCNNFESVTDSSINSYLCDRCTSHRQLPKCLVQGKDHRFVLHRGTKENPNTLLCSSSYCLSGMPHGFILKNPNTNNDVNFAETLSNTVLDNVIENSDLL